MRAAVPERVVMAIGGWKTRSVFDKYNIVSEKDLHEAAGRLERHLADKRQTRTKRAIAVFFSCNSLIILVLEWRNWQTHGTQNPAPFTGHEGSTPSSSTIKCDNLGVSCDAGASPESSGVPKLSGGVAPVSAPLRSGPDHSRCCSDRTPNGFCGRKSAWPPSRG